MNNLTILRLRPILRLLPAARDAVVTAYRLAIYRMAQQ